MDLNKPERQLVLLCVNELLALETSLRRGQSLSPKLRSRLVLLEVLTRAVRNERETLHPAIDGLTAADVIGHQIDVARGMIQEGLERGTLEKVAPLETT